MRNKQVLLKTVQSLFDDIDELYYINKASPSTGISAGFEDPVETDIRSIPSKPAKQPTAQAQEPVQPAQETFDPSSRTFTSTDASGKKTTRKATKADLKGQRESQMQAARQAGTERRRDDPRRLSNRVISAITNPNNALNKLATGFETNKYTRPINEMLQRFGLSGIADLSQLGNSMGINRDGKLFDPTQFQKKASELKTQGKIVGSILPKVFPQLRKPKEGTDTSSVLQRGLKRASGAFTDFGLLNYAKFIAGLSGGTPGMHDYADFAAKIAERYAPSVQRGVQDAIKRISQSRMGQGIANMRMGVQRNEDGSVKIDPETGKPVSSTVREQAQRLSNSKVGKAARAASQAVSHHFNRAGGWGTAGDVATALLDPNPAKKVVAAMKVARSLAKGYGAEGIEALAKRDPRVRKVINAPAVKWALQFGGFDRGKMDKIAAGEALKSLAIMLTDVLYSIEEEHYFKSMFFEIQSNFS